MFYDVQMVGIIVFRCEEHLYTRLRWLVGWLVGPSVGPSPTMRDYVEN
jgi:hypothetical protein